MQKATLKIDIWTHDNDPSIADETGDLPELFEPHAEHVARLLAEGYTSGQIIDERFNGWWTIEHD